MAKQKFDHSEFIQGEIRKYGSIGFADHHVLDQGPRSLKTIQAQHISHSDGRRGIQVELTLYSKETNGAPFSLPTKIGLSETATRNLFDYLKKQACLEEVEIGSNYELLKFQGSTKPLSIQEKSQLVPFLKHFLESESIHALVQNGTLTPDVLNNIQVASKHKMFKEALSELELLLGTESSEQIFQDWFKAHDWIFGTTYEGAIDKRKIGLSEISDIILKTYDGYLDIFELKSPAFNVLSYDASHRIYHFSKNTAESIAQCAHYMRLADENRHMLNNLEHMPFLKPRGRIIIGRSFDWPKDKLNALRELNASLHYIELMTYDHVLEMGKQLLRKYEEKSTEDLPF